MHIKDCVYCYGFPLIMVFGIKQLVWMLPIEKRIVEKKGLTSI